MAYTDTDTATVGQNTATVGQKDRVEFIGPSNRESSGRTEDQIKYSHKCIRQRFLGSLKSRCLVRVVVL